MVRIGKILTLAAALAFPLVASGPAASAATPSYVTRGQYVEELLTAVGVQPATSAQQNFSDVPPSSPYFGYVEAAYQAGITTGMVAPANGKMGVFGVNQDLNRAQAAAFDLRAYDSGVAAYAQSSSPGTLVSFGDFGAIPQALQSDVYTATDIGLIHGFTDGTFGPLETLTSAQTVHLIAQLKAVEATGGSYNWRWIVAENSNLAETSSENAMNFFADAVQGKPFSSVAGYVNVADASALETTYSQIEDGAAANFNGGNPGTTNATIKIVGGGFAAGSAISGGGWHGVAIVIVEAISNATGKPSAVNGNSPYIKLLVPVNTDSNGLVVQSGSAVSSSSISTVSSGESVAGIVMYFLGGTAVIYPNSENAAAVVGGLGLAQTAAQ